MTLEELIDAHAPHVALQFSGGRDSLAMLLALRGYLHKVTVYYTNSGDAYPETKALADAVRSIAPHFVEIQGRVKEVHETMGWPSDVLQPGTHWPFARENIAGYVPLIDRHQCCAASIMVPMHERMRADGVTLILRGQRDEDSTKSHVKNGEVVDGFTIAFPIASWSTEQVESYILDHGVPVPPYYAAGMTSAPDCMRCTAWLEHGVNKYLPKHHPEVAREVGARLKKIKVTVEPFIQNLHAAQEAMNG